MPRVELVAIAVLALVAGTQTVRLANEQAAHAQTGMQWGQERAQAAQKLATLGQQYRAQEGALQEQVHVANSAYFMAQAGRSAAVAAAARSDERMHQLAARATSAAGQLPGPAASASTAGPACAAQLQACAGLLAAGAGLAASGAELAGAGGHIVGELGAKVELCQFAWPVLPTDEGWLP